ncbi:chord-domain-containing protein [Salix suchowensis]|nr:chord-domain-containing protein [Salix suchowensis]
MPTCSRNGCKKGFEEGTSEPCTHHPGAPDVNKPVTDFDDFLKIPVLEFVNTALNIVLTSLIQGCSTADDHDANAAPVEAVKSTPNTSLHMTETLDGKEVYGSSKQARTASQDATIAPTPVIQEEDDPSVPVSPGTPCRRRGCGVAFVSDALNRSEDGEGSTEEKVSCRIDHYQTVDKVHVSVFAKAVDKDKSNIGFEASQVRIAHDHILSATFCRSGSPGIDRFISTPVQTIFSKTRSFWPNRPYSFDLQRTGIEGRSDVELHLHKQDTRSWTVLEKPTQSLGNISLTFGVGGRTGTIGGKEVVLDGSNKACA